MNTNTPRTDAHQIISAALLYREFAKNLERDLNEARKEAENLRDYHCNEYGPLPYLFPWEEKQSTNSKPWLNEAAALGKETRKD